MPHLDEFHQTNKEENFVVIAVSPMETKNTVKGFIEEKGYSFPVLLDTTVATAYVYQVRYTPTTYLINKEGKIVDLITGPLNYNELKEKF